MTLLQAEPRREMEGVGNWSKLIGGYRKVGLDEGASSISQGSWEGDIFASKAAKGSLWNKSIWAI
jgi:hypothetical protein